VENATSAQASQTFYTDPGDNKEVDFSEELLAPNLFAW